MIHVKTLTILDSGPDGKLKIEDKIFDLPSGYTTTYSNLNENIRKNKERSRQNNQEMDLAINQSLMENLGISGKQSNTFFSCHGDFSNLTIFCSFFQFLVENRQLSEYHI